MTSSSLDSIQQFLAMPRLAIIGVSRDPGDFTRQLFAAFVERGYLAFPVNPKGSEIHGLTFYATVKQIEPPVECALLMTKASDTLRAVEECAEAGIKRIWLYRGVGTGSVSTPAVAFCQARGIDVIAGECPFMFFPATSWIHRMHGFVRRITGSYPAGSAKPA